MEHFSRGHFEQGWGKRTLKQENLSYNGVSVINLTKKKLGILIFGGLWSLLVQAQSLAEFCFERPSQRDKAISYAGEILLGSEKFIHSPGQSCTQIYLSSDRFELVDLFIRKRFRLVSSSGSLVAQNRRAQKKTHCSLTLKEQGRGDANSHKGKLGTQMIVKSYGSKISNQFQTNIMMMAGKSSEVFTPEGKVEFTCTITNAGVAIVKISAQNKLATQVMLQPGQELTIGGASGFQKGSNLGVNSHHGVQASQQRVLGQRTYSLKFNAQ